MARPSSPRNTACRSSPRKRRSRRRSAPPEADRRRRAPASVASPSTAPPDRLADPPADPAPFGQSPKSLINPWSQSRQTSSTDCYVKLLLLQQWYGLSDPSLEEAVDDRLSFRRFAGLPLDEGVPDHSTIWRFRQELAAHGLAEALFEEINRQLDARGLIVRQGTLIDATLL